MTAGLTGNCQSPREREIQCKHAGSESDPIRYYLASIDQLSGRHMPPPRFVYVCLGREATLVPETGWELCGAAGSRRDLGVRGPGCRNFGRVLLRSCGVPGTSRRCWLLELRWRCWSLLNRSRCRGQDGRSAPSRGLRQWHWHRFFHESGLKAIH